MQNKHWLTGGKEPDTKAVRELAKLVPTTEKSMGRWISLNVFPRSSKKFYEVLSNYFDLEVTEVERRHINAWQRRKLEEEKLPVSVELKKYLREALRNCSQYDLERSLLFRFQCNDIDALCEYIAEASRREGAEFFKSFRPAIDELIHAADGTDAVDAIVYFVFSVALLYATPTLDENGVVLKSGIENVGNLCLLRLHLDANLLSQSKFRQGEMKPHTYPQPKFDIGLQNAAPNAVALSKVKNTNEDHRLWATVKMLNEKYLQDGQVPRPDTDDGKRRLSDYLRLFNVEVDQVNESSDHYFVYALHTECPGFLRRLTAELPALRVLASSGRTGQPLFHIESHIIEHWLARCLTLCKKKFDALTLSTGAGITAHVIQDRNHMKEKEAMTTNITTTINGPVTGSHIGDRGQVNYKTRGTDVKEIRELLQGLLDAAQGSGPGYKEIRAATRDIQTAIEDERKPDTGKLEKGLKVATLGEKITNIGHKVVGTIASHYADGAP